MAETNGIMPVMDMNGGSGGYDANWLWIIVIFALLGWSGNGIGGNNGALTQSELQSGFDTSAILTKLDGLNTEISSGLCDGFYAMNTGLLNGFAGVNETIGQLRYDNQAQSAEINRNIDATKYDNALQTQTLLQNNCENTQKILDAITSNRMADMQNEINQLQLQAQLGNVVRYPSATTWTAGYSPCFSGNCSGNY